MLLLKCIDDLIIPKLFQNNSRKIACYQNSQIIPHNSRKHSYVCMQQITWTDQREFLWFKIVDVVLATVFQVCMLQLPLGVLHFQTANCDTTFHWNVNDQAIVSNSRNMGTSGLPEAQ